MKYDFTKYSENELSQMVKIIHDSSLQTENNPFIWIVYDTEAQRVLFEYLTNK